MFLETVYASIYISQCKKGVQFYDVRTSTIPESNKKDVIICKLIETPQDYQRLVQRKERINEIAEEKCRRIESKIIPFPRKP